MKIAVDLDDTIANFTLDFLEFYNKKYGKNFTLDSVNCYDYYTGLGLDKETLMQILDEFYQTEGFADLGLVTGAKEGIEKLANDNELYIVTGRPVAMRQITEDWVNKYFPGIFEEILITNTYSSTINDARVTKSSFCLSIGAPVIIDDNLLFAKECANQNVRVLLFDCPWNQEEDLNQNIARVYSWQEITEQIQHLQTKVKSI